MAMLTEQDFKDLEQAARFGIRNYHVMRSLSEGEFDSLENMLDKLSRCSNEMVARLPSIAKYLVLTSSERVRAGDANALTAHHLIYNLVYGLWSRIQIALNPDDERWDRLNPDDLRIENLSQYRDAVIKAINLMPPDVDMGKADELMSRVKGESLKAWHECQQQQAHQPVTLHKATNVKAGAAFMEKISNDKESMQAFERVKQRMQYLSKNSQELFPDMEKWHQELVQKLAALGFTLSGEDTLSESLPFRFRLIVKG